MKKRVCFTIFLAAICSLVFLPQQVPAQEWVDELRSLLDRISNEVDAGLIEDVAIESESARTVYLSVSFAGVDNSSEMILTAQVLGVSMRTLTECHADAVPLPGPSGSARVPIEYKGTSEAFSMFLRVVLFDRSTGTVVDTRRIRFSRRWASEGSAGETAVDTAEPAEQETTLPPPEEREPIVVEPRRIGNTPEIREEPEETSQPEEQPGDTRPADQPRETVTEMRPAEVTLANTQLATAATISFIPNFFTLAPNAKWANDKLALRFGGNATDKRGFAVNHESAVLNDNRTHKYVLQSHPRWAKDGQILGRYEKLTVPKDAKLFETGLGFIRGGKAGDVTFVVTFRNIKGGRSYTLLRQRLRYADGVVSKRVPIPVQLKGQVGMLTLTVEAGESSAQDWAVWINPRITN